MKKTFNLLFVLACLLCSCGTDDMDDFENFKILMPPGTYVIESFDGFSVDDDFDNKVKFTRHNVCHVVDSHPDYSEYTMSEIVKKDGNFYIQRNSRIYEAQSRRITERDYELKLKESDERRWKMCKLHKL